MRTRCCRMAALLLAAALAPSALLAQKANDTATQQAILAALPAGVAAEQATADAIAQAATDLVFGMEGPLEANITQVMVSLGELAQAGRFKAAPRFGDGNPTGRFYTKIMNLASSFGSWLAGPISDLVDPSTAFLIAGCIQPLLSLLVPAGRERGPSGSPIA